MGGRRRISYSTCSRTCCGQRSHVPYRGSSRATGCTTPDDLWLGTCLPMRQGHTRLGEFNDDDERLHYASCERLPFVVGVDSKVPLSATLRSPASSVDSVIFPACTPRIAPAVPNSCRVEEFAIRFRVGVVFSSTRNTTFDGTEDTGPDITSHILYTLAHPENDSLHAKKQQRVTHCFSFLILPRVTYRGVRTAEANSVQFSSAQLNARVRSPIKFRRQPLSFPFGTKPIRTERARGGPIGAFATVIRHLMRVRSRGLRPLRSTATDRQSSLLSYQTAALRRAKMSVSRAQIGCRARRAKALAQSRGPPSTACTRTNCLATASIPSRDI